MTSGAARSPPRSSSGSRSGWLRPRTLTVKAGTTVTWINEDDIPHTVVSTGHFRSKPLDTGDRFTFTFTTAGSFQYFCSLHPHMQASITVEATTGSLNSH